MAVIPIESERLWHPNWVEPKPDTAGEFVHFRKHIYLKEKPTHSVSIKISVDTKYQLYVNCELVCTGPVKGDDQLWFYDTLDLQPYLRAGDNHFAIRVLRLYHATSYATSFPRLPLPGLFLTYASDTARLGEDIEFQAGWETSLDCATTLPINIEEDAFLNVYEYVNGALVKHEWLPAVTTSHAASHGLSSPWNMSPRMIPHPRHEPITLKAVKLAGDNVSVDELDALLSADNMQPIRLPAGSTHRFEIQAQHHVTAALQVRFERPETAGSTLKITYSECYEDEPTSVPWLRRKGDRCDTTKQLRGPVDTYIFGGPLREPETSLPRYDENRIEEETFRPMHFRTFRFLAVDITVSAQTDLVLKGISAESITYPLDVIATINVPTLQPEQADPRQLWSTSLLTLNNCMHDGYEDCPFYEQLQYAMDTRSSILFTYCVAADDRLARQAIVQLHNSYRPQVGLTASRAPSHQQQIIPHFSLFWVCMVVDHLQQFNDVEFVSRFAGVCHCVLDHFKQRIDATTGLVRGSSSSKHWDFVDWTHQWRPMGIPPAAERTGFCTFTNMLYAYTLQLAAQLMDSLDSAALASEYRSRAAALVQAIRRHCFDGQVFTDGLAAAAVPAADLSLHSQVWAVLCGAIEGPEAARLLKHALHADKDTSEPPRFTPCSTAMSFYVLRAMSQVGGDLYDTHLNAFWEPWRKQLSLNLSTWEEDSVSQRSDCHAWGCSPLYEFTREVVGVRPAGVGSPTTTTTTTTTTIEFEPRLKLYPAMEATVPFGQRFPSGSAAAAACEGGVAHVRWRTLDDGTTAHVTLRVTGFHNEELPPARTPQVVWKFPHGRQEEMAGSFVEISRTIRI